MVRISRNGLTKKVGLKKLVSINWDYFETKVGIIL